MLFENKKFLTPSNEKNILNVKRGATDPSLPQDDTKTARQKRKQQISDTQEIYQWASAEALPGVPIANGVPKNDKPSIEWWFNVLKTGVEIITNIIAVIERPIFSGIEKAGLEIIHEAINRADQISSTVEQLRKKHGVGSKDNENNVEKIINEAEQSHDMEKLENLANEIHDITEIIFDILKAVDSADTKSLESYRDLFQTIETPSTAYTFLDDMEFARLRVAGPNPMLVKSVEEIPTNFPITEAQYAASIANDNLTDALSQGRIFLCDYIDLNILVAGVWEGNAKYVYQPMALFAVPPNGSSLTPVAIQCGQDPKKYPIMLPSINASQNWGWQMAKFIVQVADCNYHELFVHLAGTHLVSEAIAVATRRNLAEVHPLWSLLVPHFEGTLFINNMAVETLINKGGPIDAFFGGTITSSQLAAAEGRLSFDFYGKMIRNDLITRKVEDASILAEYPYRDDAILVWDAIHDWASEYIKIYYKDDMAVTNDSELKNWVKSISSAKEGRILGFKPITSREQLIDVCTMIIFTASAQHAAVNFPQREMMLFAPAITGGGWAAAPNHQQSHTKKEWLDYMPPMSLALLQQASLILLGSVYYRPLGEYQTNRFPYRSWFQDERITQSEGPLERFQAGLQEVEKRIVERNQERMHPYQYLQPSLIPTSTNI